MHQEVDDIVSVASDFSPEQQALFEQGCQVMLGIERARLQWVLARHMRQGTSKYARSISKEGIQSVTLDLSAALWVSRSWIGLFVGFALVLPTHGIPPLRIVGFIVLASGVALLSLGIARICSGVVYRRKFQNALPAGPQRPVDADSRKRA